jgi:hypothetical protein
MVAPPSSKGRSAQKDTVPLLANQILARRTPGYLQNCKQNVIAMLDALDRADFD